MKAILFLTLVLFAATSSFSQDIIILKDDLKMKVKVIEITTTMIKYKRFDQENGPLRNIAIADVKEIMYEDGTWDNFENRTKPNGPPEIVLPKREKKDAVLSSGIFLDLMLGYSQRQEKGFYYYSYSQSAYSSSYRYTDYITLSLRFGNKWYFGKREKWRPGIQANWIRLGINVDPTDLGYSFIAGPKNLTVANVGMCNVFKLSENIGFEANFVTGFNLEVDIDNGFLVPGIAMSPEVKFRYKNLAIGLNYTKIKMIESFNDSNWDILDISVGLKF